MVENWMEYCSGILDGIPQRNNMARLICHVYELTCFLSWLFSSSRTFSLLPAITERCCLLLLVRVKVKNIPTTYSIRVQYWCVGQVV